MTRASAGPGPSLNAKQARFVEEYLIDLNATQAAIRAGYSARSAEVTGHRLLRNAKIAEAVALAQGERTDRVNLTMDWVLRRLMDEAERTEEGSSPSARVAALKELRAHLSMAGGEDSEAQPLTIQIGVRRAVGDVRVTKPE